jgi:WD40 repeat protein
VTGTSACGTQRLGESSRLWASATLAFISADRLPSICFSACLYILRGHTSTIRCLKVLEGRPLVVSGSRDATLRVWDVEKGVLVHLLAGHQHSVRCIEVAGNQVVSGSYDCTCRVGPPSSNPSPLLPLLTCLLPALGR